MPLRLRVGSSGVSVGGGLGQSRHGANDRDGSTSLAKLDPLGMPEVDQIPEVDRDHLLQVMIELISRSHLAGKLCDRSVELIDKTYLAQPILQLIDCY
jgi:hypothetical protein